MIKTYEMLIEELSNYKAPANKLRRLVEQGQISKLTKGLYETNKNTPGYLIANAMYTPSYLSFDYALSYHNLIPEAVYTYTSATYKKKKKKRYINDIGTFTYQDIPSDAYPYDILMVNEDEKCYFIASAEKALCDKLYSMKPMHNKEEMHQLLFHDLRIDEDEFLRLNGKTIDTLCDLYHSTNLKLLKKVKGDIDANYHKAND